MAKTIKEKRQKGETGGLGLIRLVSENKANIRSYYNKKRTLTITAKIEIKELL